MASVLLLFVALRDGTVTREDALMLWLGSMVQVADVTTSWCSSPTFSKGVSAQKVFLEATSGASLGWGSQLVPEWFCIIFGGSSVVVLDVQVWWFPISKYLKVIVCKWMYCKWQVMKLRPSPGWNLIGVSLVATLSYLCWWGYQLGLFCQVILSTTTMMTMRMSRRRMMRMMQFTL